MKPYEKHPPDNLYEELMLSQFRETSLDVTRDPRINGKTPDLLVQAGDGLSCIVECTTLHWANRHNYKWEDGLGTLFVDDSYQHNTRLWSTIKGKLKSYASDTFPGYRLVIAIYNWSLSNDDLDVVEVCFGQYNQTLVLSDGQVLGRGWDRPDSCLAIFEEKNNRHCSAIIHSTHLFALKDYKHVDNVDAHHLLIPNPNATKPVPESLFPFCDVLDLSDGSIPPNWLNSDGSIRTRRPRGVGIPCED